MAKDKDYKRMIHTSRWLKLRRDKLSDYPLCERCEQMGKVTAATEVHHVHPVEMGRCGKVQAKNKAKVQLQKFAERFLGRSAD